ncbi:hypothetical protein [Atlantibacter hermannii]|uniref:hypothetical protein n=1 Tax=Atlantibacter hermannii TaxID=565 RepID=UPI0028AF9654|nr:hypothetical protein [Atlantibacter hermannii]
MQLTQKMCIAAMLAALYAPVTLAEGGDGLNIDRYCFEWANKSLETFKTLDKDAYPLYRGINHSLCVKGYELTLAGDIRGENALQETYSRNLDKLKPWDREIVQTHINSIEVGAVLARLRNGNKDANK